MSSLSIRNLEIIIPSPGMEPPTKHSVAPKKAREGYAKARKELKLSGKLHSSTELSIIGKKISPEKLRSSPQEKRLDIMRRTVIDVHCTAQHRLNRTRAMMRDKQTTF